jgi:hypothetical protein
MERAERLSVVLLNRQRRRRVSPARLRRVLGGAAAARLDPESASSIPNASSTPAPAASPLNLSVRLRMRWARRLGQPGGLLSRLLGQAEQDPPPLLRGRVAPAAAELVCAVL